MIEAGTKVRWNTVRGEAEGPVERVERIVYLVATEGKYVLVDDKSIMR